MSMAFICAMTLMSCNELAAIKDNPVSSCVQFPKAELAMVPGTQVQNTATTISTEKITYTTSDATVATVDQSGLITALAEGEATITASVPGNEYYAAGSATCLVKVGSAELNRPTLSTPLTFEVLTDGTITVSYPEGGMYYKKNGGDQVALTKRVKKATINVTKGDKVEFYGTATDYGGTNFGGGTAEVKVYGNIMSLISATGFADNKTLTAHGTFYELFKGYAKLKDASNLFLPAESLVSQCYYSMFEGCTSLTAAPKELPADELTEGCYNHMFQGCSSLTTAPKLPATKLANRCYNYMFRRCTSLTNAYVKAAYVNGILECLDMFTGCSADGAKLHTTSDHKASWDNMMGSGKTWSNWTADADWTD